MISKEVIITVRKYKCNVLKMHLKLKDQKLKTITYIERLLYKNLMLTTKQKSIIQTRKIERNPNITLKIVIKSQGKRERKKEGTQKNYKTIRIK